MLGEGIVHIDKQGLISSEDLFDISLVYPLERPQEVLRIRLYLPAGAIQRLFREKWMLHKHMAGQLTEKNILIRGPHDERRLPCVGEDQDLLLFEIQANRIRRQLEFTLPVTQHDSERGLNLLVQPLQGG